MEPGAIVFVRMPYDNADFVVWPGWVIGPEGEEFAVKTTDAAGRLRDVVFAADDAMGSLESLASEGRPESAFVRGENLLLWVVGEGSPREVLGYRIVTSLHDVATGENSAMVRSYGLTMQANADMLTPVRAVVAEVRRARDSV